MKADFLFEKLQKDNNNKKALRISGKPMQKIIIFSGIPLH